MGDYFETRKLEENKLNDILYNMSFSENTDKMVVVFEINGYVRPYDSTIVFYNEQPLNLPEKINDVKIKQIYQLKCRNCMAMAYPRCFCKTIVT